MFTTLKLFLLISTTIGFSTLAYANPKLDMNGDDEISRIEYMSFKSNTFNKQDKNFDGRLTKQEIRDARQKQIRQSTRTRFKAIDKNGDGHITPTEHDDSTRARSEKKFGVSLRGKDEWFDKMDADNNDNISRLEYNAFLENQRTERIEKSLKNTLKAFARLDLDGDGIITEFEYVDKGRLPGAKVKKTSDPMEGLNAHETAKPKKRLRRDGNNDGDVTKREDREYNEYQFERLDKDDSGSLTKKEAGYLFKDYRNITVPH